MIASYQESKTVFTAEDRTGGAFDSMQRSLMGMVSRVQGLQAVMAGIAGVGALGAFVAMTKQAMETADQMGKLAQKTGLATEEASRLAYAAKLSDVETGALQKGIKGLSNFMVEATDATSKQAAILRTLGVDIRGGLSPALSKIADTFKQLEDGEVKTALATNVFGKSAQDLIPLLNEGSQGIERMKTEADRLGLTISKDFAKSAQEFNDNMKALGSSSQKLGIELGNWLAPQLTNVTNAIKEALIEGGKLKALWVALGGLGAFLFTDDTLSRQQQIVKGLREMNDALTAQRQRLQDASDMPGPAGEKARAMMERGIELKMQQIAALQAEYDAMQKAADATQKQTDADKKAAKQKEELLRQQLALNKDREKEGATILSSLQVHLAAKQAELQYAQQLGEGEKALEKLRSGAYDKLTEKTKKQIEQKATELAQVEQEIRIRKNQEAVMKDLNRQQAEYEQGMAELIKSGDNAVKTLSDSVETMRVETEALGMNNAAREQMLLALEKERVLRSTYLDDAQRTTIENLYAEKAALIETRGAFDQQRDRFRSVFDIVDGGFKAALNGAKSFGDYIKNGLKNALYELIARPFVIQIAASLTGSNAQVVQAALGNNGGIGSLFGGQQGGAGSLGGLGNIASSILGQGGMLSGMGGMIASGLNTIGFTGASQFVGGLTGSIVGPALPGSALAAGQGAAGMLGSLGPYAAAAAAIYTIYRTLQSRRGGDKDGGSFIGDFSGLTGSLVAPNLQHRFFTPSGMDGSMQTLAQGTASSYAEYVRRLGGTAANVSFGFGADSDPRGTAQDRVSALAFVGGQGVYYNRDRDVGRGGANIVPELQLESQRALIAALQATEMPAAIKKLFEGVNAMTLTADAATKLLDTATKYADALDALRTTVGDLTAQLDGLSDDGSGIANLRRQIAALSEAVTTAQEAYESAMSGTDPTAQLAALQQLTAAVTNRYNQEMQMVRSIAAAIDQAREGAYQFTLAMAQRYNNVGRYTDTSAASMARVGQLRESIDSTTDPAARLGYVNQALTALDNWVTSSRETVTRDFNARMAAQQQELAAIQTAAATRKTALQNEIEAIKQQIGLMQSFQQLASQARAAITALSLSGSNPLSVFGRFGLAGDNVQSLLATYRNATGQDRITAAGNVMQALQSRMALAGEAYQRPSDEYQAAYNEVVTAYSEIADSAQSEADRLYKLQEEIDSKTAEILKIDEEIKRVIEKQVDYSGEMNAALEAINAQAYAQYQILDAIGQESYAQSERHNLELLNALTGGDSIPVYTARETRTIRETLQAILDRMDGGGSLGNRSADPGAGVDRTRILAGGGGPPIEGDDTGVRVQTPITVQLPNGGALAEFVLETVVGNGGAIVRVLDHLR